jgi:regulatory protein
VLDDLQAKGFINEQRVVESVVHRRAAKLGVRPHPQELQSKGLEPGMVLDSGGSLRATEVERAREVWRKKFGALPPARRGQRGKQMRFLAARFWRRHDPPVGTRGRHAGGDAGR